MSSPAARSRSSAAKNIQTGQDVAIKKVLKVFEKSILAKRALREIKLLKHFNGHENITSILDMDISDINNFQEIYLVQDLMEADLHQIIRSEQPLTDAHFQYFIYQICRGLKYIHSANVLHRDLKPGNLLVNADCELKICDFGLARGLASTVEDPGFMTEYVATRWYRAPEIMLSFRTYTKAIDMWSIGCIFAELLGGKPLFKGRDYVDQLNHILNILGTPDEDTLRRIGSERAQLYIKSLRSTSKVPWVHLFPRASNVALDLLERLLSFDPSARVTVEEALKHPYLEAYHDITDEPSHPMLFDFGFESIESMDDMKRSIAQEVNDFKIRRNNEMIAGNFLPRMPVAIFLHRVRAFGSAAKATPSAHDAKPSSDGSILQSIYYAAVPLGAYGLLYWLNDWQLSNARKAEAEANPRPALSDPSQFQSFSLVRKEALTPNTSRFVFALPEDATHLGLPTASCVVARYVADDKKDVVRAYTPVEDPAVGYSGTFDLIVKKYPGGPMSSYIHSLRRGDRLELKGPILKYKYEANKEGHIGLIAGGSGLTPMLQVIQRVLSDKSDKTKLTLLFANVTESDIILRDYLDKLARQHPERFAVHYTVDKPSTAWKGYSGFINSSMLSDLMPKPGNGKVFVCGPPGMMAHVSGPKAKDYTQGTVGGLLKSLGYTEADVFKF
ncbi:Mitogen-activated protein kinase [Entophlyctis luteolus]|nr:Mitogen-activated protein kinase [Entophlyctis luteolus]